MRNVIAVSFTILVALFPVAASAQSARASAPVVSEEPAQRIDTLFSELKRAGNERAAERISQNIVREWGRSGSASIDLLMEWSQQAMDERRNDAALDFLDQVVTLAPGYAEGWNRRATLHFTMDDYSKSMADIGRVLELEPRHFGALGGMATILKNSGRTEAAIRAYERLLNVYPMMRAAQTELGKLADEAAGQGI